ncbi:hypothetical protein MM236_12900 [Belliella sp. DSM 107340]|uniref:Uncharacterized protein n=1 Tax=Belliella calami TaxID=2923436 RepID=A0ABS9UQK4_9BACT|nr:hypothetical protein [Belliella calami]MCH7398896.1 hypothetical protein [Belliella calami]
MDWEIVLSIDHLKELCDINGRAEFYIILAGGLSRSGKEIHYDKISGKFEIYNEIDEIWQSDLSENELYSKTMIPEAIEKSSMFYCGYQLYGL